MISVKDNLYVNDICTQIALTRVKLSEYKDELDEEGTKLFERLNKALLKEYKALYEVVCNE